ncbi:MAG TPA: response regulator [Planctomycetota bacterium]|nr:response regulator [Planctomycetota bacterium]
MIGKRHAAPSDGKAIASDSALSALLESNPMPAAVVDRQLNIVQCNERLAQVFQAAGFALSGPLPFASSVWAGKLLKAIEQSAAGLHALPVKAVLSAQNGGIACFCLHGGILRQINPSLAIVLFADSLPDETTRILRRQMENLLFLGQLGSSMTHELNNSLTAIIGFSRLLLKDQLPPAVSSDIERVCKGGTQCRQTIEKFLACTRQHADVQGEFDVNDLIADALAATADDLRARSIACRLSLHDALPAVAVDSARVGVGLRNMLRRACSVMPGGGSLCIETTVSEDAEAKPTVGIRISDTGPGIPDELIAHAFKPFFDPCGGQQIDIGLALCRMIFRHHSGSIAIEQNSASGSTFAISLPVKAAKAAAPVQSAVNPACGKQKTKSVLVVDDDELCASLLAVALHNEGFHVDAVNDGLAALAKISKHSYDAVVTDVRMPVMDGCQLYREIRKRDPGLASRMLFVTGDNTGAEIEEFLQETSCVCLVKPFEVRDLVRAVKNCG